MQLAKQVLSITDQVRRTIVNSVLLLIVLACLLSGAAAFAQLAGKGALTGQIEDPTGAAIPNAKVTITNDATGVSIVITSDATGDYNAPTLDPGIYSLSVEATGFEKQHQQDIHINALQTVTYNPKLTIGASSITVDVSSAPPQLETSDATLGTTMEAEMYSSLPIEMGAYGSADQRRATDFATLMPGVQGNATSGGTTTNSGVVNGVGARGGATVIYIDGLPFTNAAGEGDPRFVWSAISVDAIDQFQVQTAGYSAIYEGQGVQNYHVKQGGNKFHGSGYEIFRNTALDTWGFFISNDPITGLPIKPVEHQDEYGFSVSGPPLPFGSMRQKLFYFGNYMGFKQSQSKPTMTFPTVAEQQGNFFGIAQIYDPTTQAACTAFYGSLCRYEYGYTHGATAKDPQVANGQPIDVITPSQLSPIALKLQTGIPNAALIPGKLLSNYIAPNVKALNNSSTTHRIDYMIGSHDTLSVLYAHGSQASNNPVGSTSSTNNLGPVPFNYGQAYSPKTNVAIAEETHVFSPHVVNQFKYGFARYVSAQTNAGNVPAYSATSYGYNGGPAGQAAGAFPIITFSGANAPTNFAGYVANIGGANSYEMLDNVQWDLGRHSITFGVMISWLQYTYNSATGGSTPVTIANSINETAALKSNVPVTSTGSAYASFLLGDPDKVSFTQNTIPATYARYRPISPYIQDDWKVSDKLTLNLGVRYDFFPTYHEAHNTMSYLDLNLLNPVTSTNGALNFAGRGTGTCNCDTPVQNYFKNIGPRLGLAYQIDSRTVVRSSYGVMFSHGGGVGGSTTARSGTGTLGFSASPSFAASSTYLTTAPLSGGVPAYAPALGVASGPQYGTGYTTTAGYTASPSTLTYGDPYLGSRAPEYINYSLGIDRQWTRNLTSSINYVGSQAHFLQADGGNARGYYSNGLDPKYLSLGSCLNTNVSALATTTNTATGSPTAGQNCLTALQQSGGAVPSWFNTGQQLQTALKPFPQYNVTDNYAQVSNAHYNSLRASLNLRASHGVTFMANYTWSRSIDDGGTFRSGYAIPAAFSNQNRAFAADEIERTVSVINQPHHFVFTGVERLPFGTGRLGGGNRVARALFGGYQFSQIIQTFSGSPLAITATSAQTNPAQSGNVATLNPTFFGSARSTNHWNGLPSASGYAQNIVMSGGTAAAPTGPFVVPALANTTFMPAYTFGNAPRTAPWGLTGPGLFSMDISLRRSFPLFITEGAKLSLQADLYNVTNFVQFSSIVTTVGSANFGAPQGQLNNPRQAQLSARIEF